MIQILKRFFTFKLSLEIVDKPCSDITWRLNLPGIPKETYICMDYSIRALWVKHSGKFTIILY